MNISYKKKGKKSKDALLFWNYLFSHNKTAHITKFLVK